MSIKKPTAPKTRKSKSHSNGWWATKALLEALGYEVNEKNLKDIKVKKL